MNPASKFRMVFRLTTVRVGLAMILLPIAWTSGWASWYFTRNWTPVSTAVSLAAGHIRTPEFELNVEGFYSISMGMSVESALETIPCPHTVQACQASAALIGASWSLWKSGRIVASGKMEPLSPPETFAFREVGNFHEGRGRFVLDVEIPKDESYLDTHQPYLTVDENGGVKDLAQNLLGLGPFAFLLFGPIGFCALVISGMNRHQEKSEAFLRRFPLTLPGPLPGEPLARPRRAVLHRPRYPVLKRRSSQLQRASLSHAALVLVITFQLLWAVWYFLRSFEYPIAGLPLRVIRQDSYAEPGPGIQPIVVRVAPGVDVQHPIAYMNWQRVAWEDLTAVLKKELRQRPPDWPVYVEGDPGLEWKSVVRAIDEIHSLHVQVVLIKDERAPVR